MSGTPFASASWRVRCRTSGHKSGASVVATRSSWCRSPGQSRRPASRLGGTPGAKDSSDAALSATNNAGERAFLTRKRGAMVTR